MAGGVKATSPSEACLLRAVRAMTADEVSALLDAIRSMIEGRSIEDAGTDFFIRCGRTPEEARIEARSFIATIQEARS